MKNSSLTMIILFCALPSCFWGSKHDPVDQKNNLFSFEKREVVVQAGDMGHKPWDPKASLPVQWNFNAAVFTDLLKFNKDYEILPGIIKDLKWDENSKSYNLTIDTKLEFYPGRNVTAQDVEFALIKPFIAAYDLIDHEPLKGIVGTEHLVIGKKYKPSMIEGIKTVGADKIIITLKNRNPTFLYSLGVQVPPVGPIESYKEDLYTFKKWPIGSGNYKVTFSSPTNSYVKLERKIIDENTLENTSFPLVLHFYEHGNPYENGVDLGVMAGTTGTKGKAEYTRIINDVPVAIQVLDFNHENRFGMNVLFRKAVSLAIDRDELWKDYDQIVPSHELIPSKYYGRSNKKFNHDPKASKTIISSKFNRTLSKDTPLKAWYHGIKGEELPRYIKRIKTQLEDVGIFLDFEGTDAQKFTDIDNNVVIYIYVRQAKLGTASGESPPT